MHYDMVTGKMPFMGFETYYRIVGEKTDKAPLLLIHGGPGSTHNYFEVLDSLAATTGRQVISYDQLGCGESYVEGHPELWTLKTWTDELIALREHLGLSRVHLLGQSWGGMLIISYLIDCHPEGIVSAVLSSTLPSSRLWSHEQHRLISFMSEQEQQAIAHAVATGDFNYPPYIAANDHYTVLHADEITAASRNVSHVLSDSARSLILRHGDPMSIRLRVLSAISTIPSGSTR